MSAIVLGGGVEGLAAAAVLARAGETVTLVEARRELGGSARILHDTELLRPWVVEELGLDVQLVPPPPVHGPGGPIEAPVALAEIIDAIRPFVLSLLDGPAPLVSSDAALWPLLKPALGFRMLGPSVMMELLRVAPTCAADFLAEHTSDPALAASMALPALLHTWMGPRSPSSTTPLLIHECARGDEVAGGSGALVEALEKACVGVTFRTDTVVSGLEVDGSGCHGVRLGEELLEAETVISTLGPRRTLLGLVDPMWLPPLTERDVDCVRLRGCVAKMDIDLADPGSIGDRKRLRTASGLDDIERAFDDVKHRRLPRKPVLDIRVVDGCLSVLAFGAPYELDGGWSDGARDGLRQRVLAALHEAVSGLELEGHRLLTPADLESEYGLEGGHLLHGELALDQLYSLRPTPGLSRHATAIAGLYLGSEGCHPGLASSGASGVFAARAALA
ncbi:MAG TPA: NAD(P)-binding protein [Myxococcota bacterium]|nr:NAD(P)-binding protein [Myxococcota bacterium]